METSTNKNLWYAVAVLLVVIIAVGTFFGYRTFVAVDPSVLRDEFKEIKTEYYSATTREEFLTIASQIEHLLAQRPTDLVVRAEMELFLGTTYGAVSHRGDKDIVVESINTLKNVYNNAAYGNFPRATALVSLLNRYMLNPTAVYCEGAACTQDTFIPDDNFFKEHLFNEEPFRGVLSKVGGNEYMAMVELYDLVDQLAPNGLSNYRVAQFYSSQVAYDKGLSDEKRKEYLAIVYDRLKKGDESPLNPGRYWNSSLEGVGLMLRARTLANLHAYDKSVNLSQVEYIFQRSLDIIQGDSNNPDVEFLQDAYEPVIQLHFAHFLLQAYGDEKDAEVKKLLNSLYGRLSEGRSPMRYIEAHLQFSNTTPLEEKEAIRALSSYDERFKFYIDLIGEFPM